MRALLVPNYRWLENIAVTGTEIFGGFILAVVFGIGAALLFSWSRSLEMLVMPLLVSLNMIPKVALGPLIIVWFKYGIGPNTVMAFSICFFPIVLTTARGLREVEPDLLDLVRTLKGSRWPWVKSGEHLTEPERAEREQLQGRFPQLRQLAAQREDLRALFEDKQVTTAAAGRRRLQGWMAEAGNLGLKARGRFGKALTTGMDKIAKDFVPRSSNGRTEGFDHGLRSILWRAFGMTNVKRFRLRVLDRFGRPATT